MLMFITVTALMHYRLPSQTHRKRRYFRTALQVVPPSHPYKIQIRCFSRRRCFKTSLMLYHWLAQAAQHHTLLKAGLSKVLATLVQHYREVYCTMYD